MPEQKSKSKISRSTKTVKKTVKTARNFLIEKNKDSIKKLKNKQLVKPGVDLLNLLAEKGIDTGVVVAAPKRAAAKPIGQKNSVKPALLSVAPQKKAALSKEVKISFIKTKKDQPVSPHLLNLRQWQRLPVAAKKSFLARQLGNVNRDSALLKSDPWWLRFWLLENSPILKMFRRQSTSSAPINRAPSPRLFEPQKVWPLKTLVKPNWPRLELIIEEEIPNSWWLGVRNRQQAADFANSAILPRRKVIATITFTVLAIFCLLPVLGLTYVNYLQKQSGKILGISTQALGELGQAGSEILGSQFFSAQQQFNLSANSFNQAQEQLKASTGLITNLAKILPVNNRLTSAEKLLAAGRASALAGSELSQGLAAFGNNGGLIQNNLTQALNTFNSHLATANKYVQLAQKNVAAVDERDIPAEYAASWQIIKQNLDQLPQRLHNLEQAVALLNKLIGADQTSRLLLVFQNNNELRATGGFIGSYAQIDFAHGQIKNLEVPSGGSYDLKGGLTQLVAPPQPLLLLNDRWDFWDANWWPQWPQSAAKLQWFYEHSNNSSVDAVVGLNASVVKKLLEVVGPLTVDDQEIAGDNFYDILQAASARGTDQAGNKPKKLITDAAPLLVNKLLQADNVTMLKILDTLGAALGQREFTIYSSQADWQSLVENLGWAGELADSSFDYLAVVSSNIGGGKSDEFIKQELRLEVDAQADGSVVNSLFINRKLAAAANNRNVSYLRFYLPLGAKLVSATGFEQPVAQDFRTPILNSKDDQQLLAEKQAYLDPISQTKVYQEGNKTVLANWLSVLPGQETEAVIRYRLPFNALTPGANAKYSLLLQRQPGQQPTKLYVRLRYPQTWHPYWFYPDRGLFFDQEINWTQELNSDLYFGTVFATD